MASFTVLGLNTLLNSTLVIFSQVLYLLGHMIIFMLIFRGVWITFFLGCFALFTYFLCVAWIKYFDYPVATKLTYTTQAKLDFPSVTICNFNVITASYLAKKNDPMLNDTIEYLSFSVNDRIASQELLEYMKTIDSEELYTKGAHQFEGTFLSCTYPEVQDDFFSCNLPDGLIVPTVTEMGVCHTFHPRSYIEEHGESLISDRAGSLGGLSVIMNVEQFDYMLGELLGSGFKV